MSVFLFREDRTEEVGFERTARAYPQNTDQNTEKEDHAHRGDFSSEEAPQTVPDEISRTITVKTEIQALKADFQVTKRQTGSSGARRPGTFSDMYQE